VPLHVNANGDLVVGTDGGEVIFHKPVVYQPGLPSAAGSSLVTRHSSLVQGRYRLEGDNQIRFDVGPYDPAKPLVIDPVLAYSTYLGGSWDEGASGVAVDASGNTYLTGSTSSSDFPVTAGAFQTKYSGNGDAFVSKLNATGSALAYSTYLGGTVAPPGDYPCGNGGSGIAVDTLGNVYVSGSITCSNFPTTPGAFQSVYGGKGDAFMTKLNATGSALLYSTYLGGSDADWPSGVAVDAMGSAYVPGTTNSTDLPTTPGAFQVHGGSGCWSGGCWDGFVSKLNGSGTSLLYLTYLGGNYDDFPSGIAVDASGNAYRLDRLLQFPHHPRRVPDRLRRELGCLYHEAELGWLGPRVLHLPGWQ